MTIRIDIALDTYETTHSFNYRLLLLDTILYDHIFDCTKYEKYRLSDDILLLEFTPKLNLYDISILRLIEAIDSCKVNDNYFLTANIVLGDDLRCSVSHKEMARNIAIGLIDEYPHVLAGYLLEEITHREYRKDVAILSAIYGNKSLNEDSIEFIKSYIKYS